MKFNFKQYIPGRKPSRTEQISVMKNGGFIFLSGFYRKNKTDQFKYTIINYDVDKNIIAFLCTNNGEKVGSMKISHRTNTGYVKAQTLWKDMGKDVSQYIGRYPVHHDVYQEADIHYICLSEKENENSSQERSI